MRVRVGCLVIVLAACQRTPPSATQAPGVEAAFEVDAKGARAIVDRSWTLSGRGQGVGVLIGAVRCDDTLLLSDSHGGIRKLNLATGETAPIFAETMLAMSLAVDCERRLVYAFGPARRTADRGRGSELRGYEIDSGAERVAWRLEAMMLPAIAGAVIDNTFVIGGTWMPTPQGPYAHPPASAFYRDKKVGFAVELATGESEPTIDPYDMACRGGGRCLGGSLLPVTAHPTVKWVASQPASREIALYDVKRTLVGRIDISSPLFKSDGTSVEVMDAAASVRWSASNSIVRMAVPFGGNVVATVHSLTKLPDNYVFGQSAEFDWWMNLHSLDGRKLVSDIALPGMPIGWDGDGLYAVDYGQAGRHSTPESVEILRVPLRAGATGFSR